MDTTTVVETTLNRRYSDSPFETYPEEFRSSFDCRSFDRSPEQFLGFMAAAEILHRARRFSRRGTWRRRELIAGAPDFDPAELPFLLRCLPEFARLIEGAPAHARESSATQIPGILLDGRYDKTGICIGVANHTPE
jgi:hypothetical protein